MKKLMKAVAAAAVALVASSSFATLQTTAGFENFQAGALTIGTLVSAEDNGAQGDARYWFAITNDSVATTGETIGNIVEDSGNKYLALEAQAPLYRTVKPSGDAGAALVVNDPQTISDGIYLDTMVKFTISQDAFKDGDLEDNVDKLAITCYSAEESTDTNILVRAGYVSGQTITPTNYFLNLPGNFDADAWHRLTVRAIAGVGSETAPVGFAIYLDQTLLTYDVSVAAGDATYEDALNAAVVNNLYNGTTHALLPSLVRGTFNDATTLSAVGFKGTGCLDNVAFTDEKPSFIVEDIAVSIAWDAGVATYKVMAGEDTLVETTTSGAGSTNLTLDATVTALTVTATYANGYEAGTWTVTGDGAQISGSTFTVVNGAELGIVSMVPMFDVNGVHYGTFEAALENATGTSGSPATIKLMADYTGDIQFDQNTVNYIVLDLAGRTLTGDADAAIHTGCANLTITNSTETIGHVVAPADGLAVVCEADSALTVNAGIFDGEIADDSGETATIAINAGTFYDPYYVADPTNDFYLKGNVPEGVTISAPSNGYFTVGESPIIGTFEVTVTPTENATYTVTGAASQSENVVTVAVGQTITITATPAWNYEYATTPTGWTASGDAITLEVSAAGTVEIPAPTALSGWGFYLGRPVDGAYTIDDANDIVALKNGVAAGLATSGVTFKQTADINMASVAAFTGVGGDFQGTYDGGNKTISNIQFNADTYRGLFQKTTGATIKNLTIDTVSFAAAGEGVEFGGSAFVGKVYGNTVLSNLTAKGSVAAGTPCNHSVAGIATRVYGTGVKFFECSNEASVYGEVRKVGGILGIIQGTASVDFVGCSNSGTIVTTTKTHHDIGDNKDYTTGADGLAGIIAYANAPTTLKDCVNTGTIQVAEGNTGASVGGLIGKCGSVTITDLGGNKCAANMKMIGTVAGTVTGFQYATVADNVATTVTTLAKDTTYLLERNVAAGTVFTLAAAGDTIAFDTALGYTFAGTVAAAGELNVTSNTVGTVTTYTAAEPAPAYPSYIDEITDPTKKAAYEAKYDTWATYAGVDVATGEVNEDAFLLNCKPAEVEAAKAAFKFTSISYDATQQKWVATTTTSYNDREYNGTVTVKQYSDVGCTTESETGTFFRAELN